MKISSIALSFDKCFAVIDLTSLLRSENDIGRSKSKCLIYDVVI
jgi:hypothetical protein